MDRIQDILIDLRSSDPSIRFAALTRIEETGLSPEEELHFRSMMELETDANTRFQMETILARAAIKGKKKVGTEDIISLINDPNRDDIKFTLMLEGIRRPQAPEILTALRNAQWVTFSTKILPAILKFFKKFGNQSDSENIAKLCRHEDMRVLSAAIEALEKLDPELLKKYIDFLLANPNLGIRARAIRLFSRWNPPEAMRKFEKMLVSPQVDERNIALFQAFFFPFEQIESLMLRFVSYENNLELIKKAAIVFMSNPNKQIPIKLMEIRQNCEGSKYKLVDMILRGILDSLYKAQLVNAEPAQMLEILEKHFKDKQIKLFVEHFVAGLRSKDPETRFKSAIKLLDAVKANVTGVKELLLKYYEKEPEQSIKDKLKPYLDINTEGSTQQEQEEKKNYFECDISERLRILTKINKNNYSDIVPGLLGNVQNLSSQEILALLEAIKNNKKATESSFVEKCIQSDDSEIIVGAINCLSEINPDSLNVMLPTLIKHRSDDVKIEAIKVFARVDKKQAISLLERTLLSVKPTVRRSAIFCLGQFDFPSVGKILFGTIRREADPENLEQVVSILKANPDEEIFISSYVEAKRPGNSKKEIYEDLYKNICSQLSSSMGKTEDELYATADVYAKAEEENNAKILAKKAEKKQQIIKIRRGEAVQERPFWDKELIRFTIIAHSIGAILTAIIWFGFMKPA